MQNTKNNLSNTFSLKKGSKKLLYLCACALNLQKPKLSSFTEKELIDIYFLAKLHGLGTAAAIALESNPLFKSRYSDDTIKKWDDLRNASIKRRFLFDAERTVILDFFEKNKIKYCPLKGIIIQNLYPSYEMREMADNDILYDELYETEVNRFMTGRGYELEFEGVTNHDMYTKAPVYNFELHRRLFMHTFNTVFTGYYDNIWDILIKDKDKDFSYHMSSEDFYVYCIAHAYKHYREGGTGFRSLTDIYVLDKEKSQDFDRTYVNTQLKKLGIYRFERICLSIAKKLFTNPDYTYLNISRLLPREKEMLSFISRTGIYGTEEERIKNKMKNTFGKGFVSEKDRIKYYISRLFPDENYYKEAHPFLYNNKYLIPAFVLYRAATRPFINRKKIAEEIKTVRKTSRL